MGMVLYLLPARMLQVLEHNVYVEFEWTLRTKGEAGTGNVVNAVHHARTINREIRLAKAMDESELYDYAKELRVSFTQCFIY